MKIRVSAVTGIRIDVTHQVLTEVERALMAASGIPVSVLNSFLPRVAEAAGT